MKIEATIYEDDKHEIKVTGEFHSGMPGFRDQYGAPLAPDDEPEMEILRAVDAQGRERHLSQEDEELAISALWEALSGLHEDHYLSK